MRQRNTTFALLTITSAYFTPSIAYAQASPPGTTLLTPMHIIFGFAAVYPPLYLSRSIKNSPNVFLKLILALVFAGWFLLAAKWMFGVSLVIFANYDNIYHRRFWEAAYGILIGPMFATSLVLLDKLVLRPILLRYKNTKPALWSLAPVYLLTAYVLILYSANSAIMPDRLRGTAYFMEQARQRALQDQLSKQQPALATPSPAKP